VSPKPIDLGWAVSSMLNKVDPENAGDNIDTYCIEWVLLKRLELGVERVLSMLASKATTWPAACNIGAVGLGGSE
jgi:hypothetical protein